MKKIKFHLLVLVVNGCVFVNSSALSATGNKETLEALRTDIELMRDAHNRQLDLLKKYEEKVQSLESKIEVLERQQKNTKSQVVNTQKQVKTTQKQVEETQEDVKEIDNRENKYNPRIGIVLEGQYNRYSQEDQSTPAGFTLNTDAQREEEDFTPDGTELIFTGNVNDHFKVNASVALNDDNGTTDVFVQEAFITSDIIHDNTEVKVGRFFPKIGTLNEQHTHEDDFIDRPLTNRVFLNNSYRDDGIQVSGKIPLAVNLELGAGGFKGEGFPNGFANQEVDIGAWTAYGGVSDDKGNTRWNVGLSTLQTSLENKNTTATAGFIETDDSIYIASGELAFSPTGDQAKQDISLSGEYFYRHENDGFKAPGGPSVPLNEFNEDQHGFYVQGIYKFHPQFRVGGRFSQLYSGDVLEILPSGGTQKQTHSPWGASVMMDWKSTKNATVRAQYNYEAFDESEQDDQIMLQYIMSIGTDNMNQVNKD